MRVPGVHDSLSWGKRGYKNLSNEDRALVSSAISSLNKISNDGNFTDELMLQKDANSGDLGNSSCQRFEGRAESKSVGFECEGTQEDAITVKPAMSANQLAAKATQLRMKGKHEEAEKLLGGNCFCCCVFFLCFSLNVYLLRGMPLKKYLKA